jgi:hypothetical protein
MKIKSLFFAICAAAFMATACSEKEETPAAAGISVDVKEISFDAAASSKTVSVTATRDWSSKVTYDASTEDKWLTITPASGSASSKAQTVEITALPNAGYDRTAEIKFTIGLADAVVTVSQKGTKVKTYKTIAQVREYAASNNINADANITLPADYVVKAWFISNQADLDNLNSNKSAYVQDETGGLNLYFSANNTFAFGDQVEIDLSGAGMKLYGGVMEVDGLALDKVTKIGTVTPTPKQISLDDFIANKYESQYVTFGNVQAKSTTAATWYSGTGTAASVDFVAEDGSAFQVRSSKYSKYGTETVPTGSGKIAGIASYFNGTSQLIFAKSSDYAGLTGARFTVVADDHSDAPQLTVADFISKADKSTYYKLTGTVSGYNATYCSFTLTDDSGDILVYSVDNKDDWKDKVANGGTVVLAGKYDYYSSKSQHEVVNAQIISFEAAPVVKVSAEGLVVAVSGKAFLVKTSDGYVYAFDEDNAPSVKVGDNVKVSGEKDTFYGLEEIVNYTVETVSSGNAVTHPAENALDGAAMDKFTTMFGYVSFSGKLTVSGSYYNVAVTGSTKTGSLSNPAGVDAALSGKVVDVKGYFIGLSGGSSQYFNVILTEIKESADQSGADTPGSTVDLTPGENEVLYSLTNEEIKKALTGTSTSYADVTISSASGNWKGNINPSSTITYLQLRNKNASCIKSPVFAKKVTRIVLEINEKTIERTIHALPSNTELPASATYTNDVFTASYGSVKTAASVTQSVEIKITGDVKDFLIAPKDGAVYIDAIHVFCEK